MENAVCGVEIVADEMHCRGGAQSYASGECSSQGVCRNNKEDGNGCAIDQSAIEKCRDAVHAAAQHNQMQVVCAAQRQ